MYTDTALHNFIEAKIISTAFLYPDRNWREKMGALPSVIASDQRERSNLNGIASSPLTSFGTPRNGNFFTELFRLAGETPLDTLAAEHTRLFGSNPACSNDLAEYMTEQPFNKAQKMAEMAGFYRAFGLEVEEAARPDNVSVVFEFLSFMYQKRIYAIEKGHSKDKIEILDKKYKVFVIIPKALYSYYQILKNNLILGLDEFVPVAQTFLSKTS